MLKTLKINNYALIDSIEISFDMGMTSITGETGAGKSVLLGGLGLVLGKRVDFSHINDINKINEMNINMIILNIEQHIAEAKPIHVGLDIDVVGKMIDRLLDIFS